MAIYTHQLKNWPQFDWNEEDFISLLGEVRNLQGKLMGKVEFKKWVHQVNGRTHLSQL